MKEQKFTVEILTKEEDLILDGTIDCRVITDNGTMDCYIDLVSIDDSTDFNLDNTLTMDNAEKIATLVINRLDPYFFPVFVDIHSKKLSNVNCFRKAKFSVSCVGTIDNYKKVMSTILS
jgi:hypothetical protein